MKIRLTDSTCEKESFKQGMLVRPVRLARSGHRVFIPATGVRIPYGTPFKISVLSDSPIPLGITDAQTITANPTTRCPRK